MAKGKKKNGNNHQKHLTNVLLIKAALDILLALINIIRQLKE